MIYVHDRGRSNNDNEGKGDDDNDCDDMLPDTASAKTGPFPVETDALRSRRPCLGHCDVERILLVLSSSVITPCYYYYYYYYFIIIIIIFTLGIKDPDGFGKN